jgi:hypothetical protein
VVVVVVLAELAPKVVLITGDGSSGSGIDPELTEVPTVTIAVVVGTKDPCFAGFRLATFGLGFRGALGVPVGFFLADGFVTFLPTTPTGVDTLAKGTRLIEMGTGTSP